MNQRKARTLSTLTNFLGHDPKDRDNLNHNLDNDVRHRRRRSDVYVFLKPFKKEFQATKQVCKGFLASADILDGLRSVGPARSAGRARSRKMLT